MQALAPVQTRVQAPIQTPVQARRTGRENFVVLLFIMSLAAAWQLGQGLGISSVPTYPAGLLPGSPIVMILGAVWLIATLGLVGSVLALAKAVSWWRVVAVGAALVSLALCLVWWHDGGIGAALNAAVLAGVAASKWLRNGRNTEWLRNESGAE